MMKLPFSRKPTGEDGGDVCVQFARYCREELERRRDGGSPLDEERFQAAVSLAVGRLREMEQEESA